MRHTLLVTAALLILAIPVSADLHPIVEVETGYFFGASENGKWIAAEKAAKRVPAETTFRVYGLTGEVAEVKGGKPKSIEEPCPDVLEVKLLGKTEGRRDRAGSSLECVAEKSAHR